MALSWASWSEGTRGVPDSEGVGDGSAADRTADKDTAGTSRCMSAHDAAVKVFKVTIGSPDGQNHHTNGALCGDRHHV
ncbi:hypothetical protein GCM10010415_48900 [Streptomyces atrovirens]